MFPKPSIAWTPKLRVLDLIPVRSSSLKEPLKKIKGIFPNQAKIKSKYCVLHHVSNGQHVAFCINVGVDVYLLNQIVHFEENW